MENLTIEEKQIVDDLRVKYGDIFYAMIGSNHLKGMDLKTSIWDCYNKLNTRTYGNI